MWQTLKGRIFFNRSSGDLQQLQANDFAKLSVLQCGKDRFSDGPLDSAGLSAQCHSSYTFACFRIRGLCVISVLPYSVAARRMRNEMN